MDPFQDLDTDIIILLLTDPPNAKTLLSMISASPAIFRVFLEFKETILRNLVIREDLEGILGIAQANLASSKLQQRGIPKEQALKWIDEHHDVLMNVSSPLAELPTRAIVDMAGLHQNVKFFTNRFVRKRLWMLDPENQLSRNWVECKRRTHHKDISITERRRLYRAIHRYAVFGNLFAYDKKSVVPKDNQMSSQEQSSYFLSLFTAWEVEEISCINDFINDEMEVRWERMIGYYHFCIISNDLQINSCLHSFFFGSLEYYQQTFKYDIISLGLSSLRQVFCEGANFYLKRLVLERLYILIPYLNQSKVPIPFQSYQNFLTDALLELPASNTSEVRTHQVCSHWQQKELGLKMRFHSDSLDLPNSAWICVNAFEPCHVYIKPLCYQTIMNFEVIFGLRRCGFVFWDCERLDNCWKKFNNPGETYSALLEMDADAILQQRVVMRIQRHMLEVNDVYPSVYS